VPTAFHEEESSGLEEVSAILNYPKEPFCFAVCNVTTFEERQVQGRIRCQRFRASISMFFQKVTRGNGKNYALGSLSPSPPVL
jgi:hypothetical protein